MSTSSELGLGWSESAGRTFMKVVPGTACVHRHFWRGRAGASHCHRQPARTMEIAEAEARLRDLRAQPPPCASSDPGIWLDDLGQHPPI